MRKRMKMTLSLVLAVFVALMIGGCTVSNGVFTGMSQQSGDTSFGASYISFNGSLSRSVSLEAGDELQFSFEGGEELRAIVRQGDQELCEISDGSVFTVPEDGSYAFTVEGEAKNGAFTFSWQIG